MSAEERAAIRKADAEDARRSRARHGLQERIEDPAAVAALAKLLRAGPAPEPKESTGRHEPRSECAGARTACLRRAGSSNSLTRRSWGRLGRP